MNDLENYSDFTVSDFVWNDKFREWVLSPDVDSDHFWNNWLIDNPEKMPIAEAAKKIISSLKSNEQDISEEDIAVEIQVVLDAIDTGERRPHKKKMFATILHSRQWRLGMVASIIIIITFGIVLWYAQPDKEAVTYQEMVRSADNKLVEKINESIVSQDLQLPDGSKVILHKHSRISYSKAFNTLSERTVYLSGTALFQVTKNADRPFLVYANGLITKVLGTTFIIHSRDAEKKVSVEVISGVVSVYPYLKENREEETSVKKLNTRILTANQEVKYSYEDKTLSATLVPNPVIVSAQAVNFTFEDASIDSVFRSIERAYGIDIIYDDKSLAKRTFTATLTVETLYEKMDIICKSVNARYEIIDAKIVVYSNVTGGKNY